MGTSAFQALGSNGAVGTIAAVSSPPARKPGSALISRKRLFSSRPAPINSMSDNAISPAASTQRMRCRATPKVALRPPSFKFSFAFCRAATSAGPAPKTRLHSTETHSTKTRTPPFTDMRAEFGRTCSGIKCFNASTPQDASSQPATPAANESTKLSASSKRTNCQRLAPNASRIAISRRRPFTRASSRLAAFPHAISSTRQTAPSKISKAGRMFSTACSASGERVMPTPVSSCGYCAASCRATALI